MHDTSDYNVDYNSYFNTGNIVNPFDQAVDQAILDPYSYDDKNIKPLDDRYESVKANLSTVFDPDKHITSTYLWPRNIKGPCPIQKQDTSFFPQGSFPINLQGETTGYLMDNTPVRVKTLVDSGASKPILNKRFYDKNPFLQQYPRYKIRPRGMRVANGKIIRIDECITLMIQFSGHVFEMVVYLMPIVEQYDFVIGQKTMYELEGGLNFGNLSFHFMMRSIPLLATCDMIVESNQEQKMDLEFAETPPEFDARCHYQT